jgi:nucleotide-binding universal stress UspA family protein
MADHNPSLAAAVEDFRRARGQANLEQIVARFTGKSVDLLSYEEVRQQLQARETGFEQLKEIPLDAIVGSVGRYTDFTRTFLPRKSSSETRWARVKLAMTDLSGLPPIEVYQIGGAYFVRDGNHRVSVARQLGATHIQAYVTEVRTKLPLSPDAQPDDLILKAEYVDFLELTSLDELRPGADLSVTAPGRYRTFKEHIEVHRYFVGLEQQREIPFEEAVAHWYDTVYLPVVQVIRERDALRHFPERTEADLYIWVSEHRAALHEELGWEIDTAAVLADLDAQFGPARHGVGERFLSAVTPDTLGSGPPPGEWRREVLAPRQSDRLFSDVLVAINGQPAGWRALDLALVVAVREAAQLNGLHVVASEAQRKSEASASIRAEFAQRCEAAGVSGKLAVEVGEVPRKMCERARLNDLVILSLDYPPPPRAMARLGSGLGTIIRRCPRPILTVPAPCVCTLNRLLLAYNDSPKAREALYVAAYLAGRWSAALVVVGVTENGQDPAETLDRARTYLEDYDVRATFLQKSGPVAPAILQAAEEQESDLILMGGYGFNPVLEVVLGSAVDEVLRTARRPMLICR